VTALSTTAQLDAPLAAVWAVVGQPRRLGEWVANHRGFTGEGPAELVVGDAFVEQIGVFGVDAELRWTVREVLPARRVALTAQGPMGITLRTSYELVEAPEGGLPTSFTLSMDAAGMLLVALGTLVRKEFASVQRESLAMLRRVVEGA